MPNAVTDINSLGHMNAMATTTPHDLVKIRPSTDTFVARDPVKSENEPTIAAHPYNKNIVLEFNKGGIAQESGPDLNRTCDLHRSTDGGKT